MSFLVTPKTWTIFFNLASSNFLTHFLAKTKQLASSIMASMTMAASFMSGAMTKSPSTSAPRRSLIVAKASEGERVNVESMKSSRKEEEGNNGRRDLLFAGAAIAACSIAKIAFADEEEPPRGSVEAKKKYNVICVTMPTARVCRK